MSAIFISYRRDDAEGHAGRLFEDLVHRFGSDLVFMDVAGIDPGRDFRKVIDEKVAECGVLLAMIGKNWLDASDEGGKRRIDDPKDFVRLETSSALRRDIPVIPVLVQGASMPHAEQLPADLAELAFRNAVELTHARWPSDVQLLIAALERLTIGTPRPESSASSATARRATVSSESPGPATSAPAVAAAAESSRPSTSGLPRSTMLVGAALILVLAFVGYAVWSGESDDIAAAPAEGVSSPADADAGAADSRGANGFALSAHDISRADFAGADGAVAGSYRETGDGVWDEYDVNGRRRFTFHEEGRDDTSVELWDDSRQLGIELDLETHQVNVKQGANAEYARLYTLVDVE